MIAICFLRKNSSLSAYHILTEFLPHAIKINFNNLKAKMWIICIDKFSILWSKHELMQSSYELYVFWIGRRMWIRTISNVSLIVMCLRRCREWVEAKVKQDSVRHKLLNPRTKTANFQTAYYYCFPRLQVSTGMGDEVLHYPCFITPER